MLTVRSRKKKLSGSWFRNCGLWMLFDNFHQISTVLYRFQKFRKVHCTKAVIQTTFFNILPKPKTASWTSNGLQVLIKGIPSCVVCLESGDQSSFFRINSTFEFILPAIGKLRCISNNFFWFSETKLQMVVHELKLWKISSQDKVYCAPGHIRKQSTPQFKFDVCIHVKFGHTEHHV